MRMVMLLLIMIIVIMMMWIIEIKIPFINIHTKTLIWYSSTDGRATEHHEGRHSRLHGPPPRVRGPPPRGRRPCRHGDQRILGQKRRLQPHTTGKGNIRAWFNFLIMKQYILTFLYSHSYHVWYLVQIVLYNIKITYIYVLHGSRFQNIQINC